MSEHWYSNVTQSQLGRVQWQTCDETATVVTRELCWQQLTLAKVCRVLRFSQCCHLSQGGSAVYELLATHKATETGKKQSYKQQQSLAEVCRVLLGRLERNS
jgi:hypothetical protein